MIDTVVPPPLFVERLNHSIADTKKHLHAFLNDAELVEHYNTHIHSIVSSYMDQTPPYPETRLPTFLRILQQSLIIHQERISAYQQMQFHGMMTHDDQEIITITVPENRINVTHDFMVLSKPYQRKSVLHEMAHGIIHHNMLHHKKLFLHYTGMKEIRHAEELAADSLSDFIQPNLSYAQILRNKAVQACDQPLFYQGHPLIESPQSRTSETEFAENIHEIMLKTDSQTHPSLQRRIENSEQIMQKIGLYPVSAAQDQIPTV